MISDKEKLNILIKIIYIFEKEIVVLIFYALFLLILNGELLFDVQLILFVVGIIAQIYLKYKNLFVYWNNFLALVMFFVGGLFVVEKTISNGFSVFLILVFSISFLYDRFLLKYNQKKWFSILSFLNSIIAISSFPILYYIFMKNKLNLNLEEFFAQGNNFLVFSGYFIFYLLILINKQLLAFQVSLYKKIK